MASAPGNSPDGRQGDVIKLFGISDMHPQTVCNAAGAEN
jgi:hypothetical protein